MTTPPAIGSRWITRTILATVAFGGTAAYAYSFTLTPEVKDLAHIALKIGVASAVCWPLFGVAVLSISGGWKRALEWAETCLVTMAWGMAVLSISTVLNLLRVSIPLEGHGCIIVISNLTMAYSFITRAQGMGLGPQASISIWLLALDLPFVLIVWLWP